MKEKEFCPYCHFEYPDYEYQAMKPLKFKIGYLSDCDEKEFKNDNVLEVVLHEDYEFEHYVGINIVGESNIYIPIEYCPKCGRKL